MYSEFFRFHGHHVLAVSTGRHALVLAARVHLVVTEMVLPGDMSGLELVTLLKSSAITRHLPVAVVTSCAWNTDRDRAMHAGSDLFLSKPCLPHDLMRAARRLLSAPRTRRTHRRSSPVVVPFRPDTIGASLLVEDA